MTGWPAEKRNVITLCGSTRFKEQFNDANFWLTINGHVVLSLGSFLHSDDDPAIRGAVLARRTQLDEPHRYKIDMSDAIMVIDVNGYAGESTRSEVEYAIRKGKPVYSYTQSKRAARSLSVLVHCDPEVLESWLTTGPATPQPLQQQQSLPNHHYARTNDNLVPVPETASKPRPPPLPPQQQSQPSYHLAAGPAVASLSTDIRQEVAPPVPPYHNSNFCWHCLHHNNCHYTDDKDGDTYCTACANAKCRKLSEFIESDGREIKVKIA